MPQVTHKADLGGVVTDLRSDAEVRSAYETIVDNVARQVGAPSEHVLVQRYIRDGLELYIGASNREVVGTIVLLGGGGLWVELLGDIASRVSPLRRDDVLDMISELRCRRLLESARGRPARDVEALVTAVVALSEFASECDRVAEVEINPLIVYPTGGGADAVDIVMTVR